MQIHYFRDQEWASRETVLTIGNFDGVHLGHQALLRRVVKAAQVPTQSTEPPPAQSALPVGSALSESAEPTETTVPAGPLSPPLLNAGGCAATAMTFDPHPQQVLGARPVPVLTSLPLRLRLFEALGLDAAYIVPFNRQVAGLTAEQFLQQYVLERFNLRRLIIGYDFAFGRNRDGSAAALRAMSGRFGFDLEIFPAVHLGEAIVSSSGIRTALAAADFQTAARLLGHPYAVLAPVERGRRLGQQLGFPTLNQPAREPLPIPFGVYAGRALVGERIYDAVSNYGMRPTVEPRGSADNNHPVLETHLFDFSGNLYDQLVEVRPIQKLRDEQKFPSLDALKAQIAEDRRTAREVLDLAQH